MTIVSGLVMFILFASELANYTATRTVEHMRVDPTLGERLLINFDITFHALHCAGAWGARWACALPPPSPRPPPPRSREP